jgi:protein involved in polysaccharide export with SLBB domain
MINKLQQELLIKEDTLKEFKKEIRPFKKEIKPSGYNMFNWIPTSFSPPPFGNITPDYIIGPGDEIKIEMWGQMGMSKTFVVDREGNIFIDKVGKITVNGLTFSETKNNITNQLKKFYSQTSVDVSMGNIRNVLVLVVGQVKVPGGYWLSSLSPAYSALYFAGGATENGSLRNVELNRNNTTKIIDLYELLLRGKIDENLRLREGDVIIIPPVSKRVILTGEIKVPAIYELKQDEVLNDLINIAGGFTANTYLNQIQIWRTVPPEERLIGGKDKTVIDVNFLNEKERSIKLFDGDSINVYAIPNFVDNYVKMIGCVRRPGLYAYTEDITLKKLILICEGVLNEAYLDRGEIIRSIHDTATVLVPFNLTEILNDKSSSDDNDIVLNKKDIVKIYSKWDIMPKDSLDVFGAAKNPGRYELFKDMTLNDVIFQAGGLQESAYKLYAEVSRVILGENRKDSIINAFSIDLSNQNEVKNFKLKRFDNVFIRENPNWMLQKNVKILGEVTFPGVYSIKSENERLSDLIYRAGGLKATAYPGGISFYRKKNEIGIIDVDLVNILRNKDDPNNITLADGDSVYIPEIINTVRVEGAVGLPRSILYQKGAGVGYYIKAAGGYTEPADKDRVSVILANGKVTKPNRFWFDTEITPGSNIIVRPKVKTQGINWGSAIADGAQILSSLITSIFIIDQIIKK